MHFVIITESDGFSILYGPFDNQDLALRFVKCRFKLLEKKFTKSKAESLIEDGVIKLNGDFICLTEPVKPSGFEDMEK